MSKVERTMKREYRSQSEMRKSYLASEWLIKEKVDQLGYPLYHIYKEARMFDVTEEYFYEFIHEKLKILINKSIAENIEKYKGKPIN